MQHCVQLGAHLTLSYVFTSPGQCYHRCGEAPIATLGLSRNQCTRRCACLPAAPHAHAQRYQASSLSASTPLLLRTLPAAGTPHPAAAATAAAAMAATEQQQPQDAGTPLAAFLTELLGARREGPLPEEAGAAFTLGAQRVLELKAAHRALCESTDTAREAAAEAKVALDQSSLQLQNLLYEKGHYEKEVSSCRGWRSAYSDEQVRLGGCVAWWSCFKPVGTFCS